MAKRIPVSSRVQIQQFHPESTGRTGASHTVNNIKTSASNESVLQLAQAYNSLQANTADKYFRTDISHLED